MITSVVLGAGIGKRMHSKLPKVLHKICGRVMIFYAIDPVKAVSDGGIIVVIGKSMPKELFEEYSVKIQEEPLGTGDAVKIAIKNVKTEYSTCDNWR